MYENELQAVLLGFDFLNNLDEKDYGNDPTFDKEDLRAKMMEIDNDVVSLYNQMPYDVLGNLHDERGEMPDDTMEDGELEDEVVVCERAINVTVALLKKISIKYLNEPYKGNSLEIFGGKSSDQTIQNIMDRVASYVPSNHDPNLKKKKRLSLDAILAIAIFIILIAAAIFS